MKLSKRETVLLVVLLIAALAFIEYRLVVVPGLNRYETLKKENQTVQMAVDETNRMIEGMPSLAAKRDATLEQISSAGETLYGRLHMDAILWNTHDLLLKSGLVLKSYTISPIVLDGIGIESSSVSELTYQLKALTQQYRQAGDGQNPAAPQPEQPKAPATETINEQEAEVYTISIQFSGNYNQAKQFISSLEAMDKSIVVSLLNLSKSDFSGNVEAEIMIKYYGVQKITETPEAGNTWEVSPFDSGTGNPFIQTVLPPVVNPEVPEPTDTLTDQTID